MVKNIFLAVIAVVVIATNESHAQDPYEEITSIIGHVQKADEPTRLHAARWLMTLVTLGRESPHFLSPHKIKQQLNISTERASEGEKTLNIAALVISAYILKDQPLLQVKNFFETQLERNFGDSQSGYVLHDHILMQHHIFRTAVRYYEERLNDMEPEYTYNDFFSGCFTSDVEIDHFVDRINTEFLILPGAEVEFIATPYITLQALCIFVQRYLGRETVALAAPTIASMSTARIDPALHQSVAPIPKKAPVASVDDGMPATTMPPPASKPNAAAVNVDSKHSRPGLNVLMKKLGDSKAEAKKKADADLAPSLSLAATAAAGVKATTSKPAVSPSKTSKTTAPHSRTIAVSKSLQKQASATDVAGVHKKGEEEG